MNRRITLAALALTSLLSAVSARAAVIDDFSVAGTAPNDKITLGANASTATLTQTGLGASTVSGSRTITLSQSTLGTLLGPSIVAATVPGAFHYTSPARRDGDVSLDYSLVGQNLSDIAGFIVTFADYDVPAGQAIHISYSITYSDSSSQSASTNYALTDSHLAILPTFTFVPPTGTLATAVHFNFDAPKAGDFTLTDIEYELNVNELPEPSAALFSAPALALLARRRRA